jgi:hypothetical protein
MTVFWQAQSDENLRAALDALRYLAVPRRLEQSMHGPPNICPMLPWWPAARGITRGRPPGDRVSEPAAWPATSLSERRVPKDSASGLVCHGPPYGGFMRRSESGICQLYLLDTQQRQHRAIAYGQLVVDVVQMHLESGLGHGELPGDLLVGEAIARSRVRGPKIGQSPAEALNAKRLLTGWSLVRIRPGEPSRFNNLAKKFLA